MAFVTADRVAEKATGSGLGALQLAGRLNASYRPFADVCADGDSFPGIILAVDAAGQPAGDWESGEFTYRAGGVIERTARLESSNNNAAVNFGSGFKQIWLTAAAKSRVFAGSQGSFEHVQSVAAASWTVNHNLGFKPNVSIKTLGGLEVVAKVLHVNNNQVQVLFEAPATGIANFS